MMQEYFGSTDDIVGKHEVHNTGITLNTFNNT